MPLILAGGEALLMHAHYELSVTEGGSVLISGRQDSPILTTQ